MPWKMSADGKNIVIGEDGNPIFINPETNDEMPVQFDKTLKKISELNNEAKTHRLKKEELEQQLNEINDKYGSIDIDKAKEAMQTLKALDKGELMTASKVKDFEKQLRDEIGKAYEGRIQEMSKTFETEKQKYSAEIQNYENQINQSLVDNFLQSSVDAGAFKKKTSILDIRLAKGYLGNQIGVENIDGKRQIIIKHWNSDRPIMSSRPEKAGEPADPEEALHILFKNDPSFDRVAANLPGGTGATGGGGRGGSQAMSTEEFYKEIFANAGKR